MSLLTCEVDLKLERISHKSRISSSGSRRRQQADEEMGRQRDLRRVLISNLGFMPGELAWGRIGPGKGCADPSGVAKADLRRTVVNRDTMT